MARYDDEDEENECSNLSSHSPRSQQKIIFFLCVMGVRGQCTFCLINEQKYYCREQSE